MDSNDFPEVKLRRSAKRKTKEIFAEHFGERAELLDFRTADSDESVREPLRRALAKRLGDQAAWATAFHLVDWREDAAFLIAVMLFPERFTNEEIEATTNSVLVHAPHHVMAAAHWMGHELRDVFDLGIKVESAEGDGPDI